ncbi:MAG: PQQ-binding-like beta-propeller repeat protein [Planctomycetota bacterium]|jgi:outer membrane protein assembly factor BamB
MDSQRRIEDCIAAPIIVLAGCMFSIGCCSIARAADWPNWRGPNYNGISDETGWAATWPKDKPAVLWRKSIGAGFSSISVSSRRVYTMGNIDDQDILYCLQPDTGKEIWKKSYECPLLDKSHEGGPAATPAVDGQAVYTFSKKGDVYRFDAASGNVIWHRNVTDELGAKQPSWYFAGSPLVLENMVILNAGTQGIALDKADGKLIWQNGQEPPGYATPVAYTSNGEESVLIFGAKALACLAATTGKPLWQYKWKTPWDENIADPIVSGDTVFISSGIGTGCALLKIQGNKVNEIWRNKNMKNHLNCSILWQGYLYGFDEDQVKCLDFKNGRVMWSQPGLGKGSLMAADGKLIILSEKGRLVIAEASPTGYRELAGGQILTGKCWTVPVLANGRIHARNAKGDLVCVDVRARSAGAAAMKN